MRRLFIIILITIIAAPLVSALPTLFSDIGPIPTTGLPTSFPTITSITPFPTTPVPTSVTTTNGKKSSSSVDYDKLCGYESFLYKNFSNPIFKTNLEVLKVNFDCKPSKITGDPTVVIVTYYVSLLQGKEPIYTYLAMRDYPVVYKVNSNVPSPPFDPLVYAMFEKKIKRIHEVQHHVVGRPMIIVPRG